MSLFHPRIIEKYTKSIPPAPIAHVAIVDAWAKNLSSGIYNSETRNDGQFIQRILVELLGYCESSMGSPWTVQKNPQVGSGNVDVALGAFTAEGDQIIAPFELKGAKTRNLDAVMPGRNKSPVQQAWEYAMDAKGAKWVLVSNYREIRLYAVGYGRKDYEKFDLAQLATPSEYKKLKLLLSAENLLGGYTASLLEKSANKDKEITDRLYDDYKTLRLQMIETLVNDNPAINIIDIIGYTQTILDRVLFVAFAEDRGLLPDNTLKRTYDTRNQFSPQPVWENFKGLFRAIDIGNVELNITGYNGGLFTDNVQLDSLVVSNALCAGFRKLGEYDFESEVSVNILGHIFEQSITDLEELKAHASGTALQKKSKRKKDGIFYTPPVITRYIVEQALGGWLYERKQEIGFDKLPELTDADYASITVIKNKARYNAKIAKHINAWEAYKEQLSQVRVIDPACGSGAFLNEVFDYLYREGQVVNNELTTLNGNQAQLFRWDTHILANNIYGVDINKESVEITKLSLWLKTANKGEKLTYLDQNIKYGNSIVDDPKMGGKLAFVWKKEFPKIMAEGGFDVVVGNPPYGADIDKITSYVESKYPNTSKAYKDIYKLFFELSLTQLLKPMGYLSFITPNTLLLQPRYEDLRNYLLGFSILSIANLGLNVFEDAVVPTCTTTLRKASPDKDTKVSYYDLTLNNKFSGSIEAETLYTVLQSNFSTHTGHLFIQSQKIKTTGAILSLGKILDFKDAGINYQRVKVGLTDKGASDLSQRLLYEGKREKASHLCYWKGEDIDRYFIADDTQRYVRPETKQTLAANERVILNDQYFSITPKLLWRQTASVLMVCLDEKGVWFGRSIQAGVVNQQYRDTLHIKYLLCLLNSRYFADSYSRIVQEGGRVFPQVKLAKLQDLPVAMIDGNRQQPFINKADIMLTKKKELKSLSEDFLALLTSEFSLKNLSGRLNDWYMLEFNEFIDEISKKKINLKVEQKAEWMIYFNKQKKIASALKNLIDTTDREIDEMVAALYM